MKQATYQIFYFSGTGNTLMLVEKIAQVLNEKNIEIVKSRIEDKPSVNPQNPIIIAFPIACFSTYPFVWQFIRNLPKAAGKVSVSVMATMGGNEGKFSTNLYRILKQKGYTPQNFRAIVMPSNLIKKEMPAEKYESVIENGKKEAANFAYNILSEERNWKPNPVVTGVYNLFMQSNKWYTLLKMWRMRFDNQKCTKCGLCAKLCPVGNIKMNEYPVYGKECVVCLRCFGNCPVKAISIGKTGFIQYHSQSASQLLSE